MEDSLESLSTRQLSAILSIPEKTLRNWTSQKKVPFYKIGVLVRFNRGEILRWYQNQKVAPLSESLLKDRIHS